MALWDLLEDVLDSAGHVEQHATLRPLQHHHVKQDAEALKDAMKGIGTKEKVLVDILTQRTSSHRLQICKAYHELTGRTLEHDLKGDTRGTFEDILVALITPPAEYNCHIVKDAIKGLGTREGILIEMFASRTNDEMKAMKAVYLKETQHTMAHALQTELSGIFSKAVQDLVEADRDDHLSVLRHKAKEDAEALFAAGEKRVGTNEAKFIAILCQKSFPHLKKVLVEYKLLSGKSLQHSIEHEMKGDLKELMLAIVKCVKSRSAYFAECLHKSMKGGGTNEATVCRIMVSRAEIDLQDIKNDYKTLFGHSLLRDIKSDFSGHVRDCLVGLCGED